MSDLVSAAKKQKLAAVEGDQNELEASGPSNRLQQLPPPTPRPESEIFKLSADCCDEIFEYLSLEDLHSFGQTSKTFNRVAGEYFKQNYSAKCFFIDDHGPNTNPNLINPFLANVPRRINYPGTIRYLTKHADEFTSMKFLTFASEPNPVIQKLLKNVDHLEAYDRIQNSIGFYENLSKMCPKLKSLYVSWVARSVSHGNIWLQQIYPELTQLKYNGMSSVDHLNMFFERNPSVRTLSINFEHIWEERDSFLKSPIELDLLDVNCVSKSKEPPEYINQIELLNKMYEHGFYKRLHLRIKGIDQQLSDKLLTIGGLEKLELLSLCQIFSSPRMAQLKRLDLRDSHPSSNEMEILANGLVNLKHISVRCKSFDSDILPFIRRARNLSKIEIKKEGAGRILNLSMLNRERGKLPGARKVTIYVDDDVFLPTKWATKNGDTNLSLVEMRRSSSLQ